MYDMQASVPWTLTRHVTRRRVTAAAGAYALKTSRATVTADMARGQPA